MAPESNVHQTMQLGLYQPPPDAAPAPPLDSVPDRIPPGTGQDQSLLPASRRCKCQGTPVDAGGGEFLLGRRGVCGRISCGPNRLINKYLSGQRTGTVVALLLANRGRRCRGGG